MKITVLIENTSAAYELKCEHGLSFLIEYNDKQYLLDAGSSSAFLDNAKTLGISLNDVEACILSHGHYDHSGGFYEYLKQNNNAAYIYAMESATGSYHSSKGCMHEIGIPKPIITEYFDSFRFIRDVYTLADDIYLIPHSTTGLDAIGKKTGLFKECDGEYLPDDFTHELSLVFDTDKGLVIFNSCSHAGIMNIINEVTAVLPDRRIYAFIGGLHMEGKDGPRTFCTFSEAEIKEITDALKAVKLEYLFTGHCTGEEGYKLLKKYLSDKLFRLTTGMRVEI